MCFVSAKFGQLMIFLKVEDASLKVEDARRRLAELRT
jgi:hypothetical protein